ncbi:MAG: DUF3073 family protein [Propionibacteriales bacterium]|nr:DUF3073 family protein [Propionibacteriales bacterium]
MGRGRAKAKQTKVARELKYRSYDTDFSELQRELRGDESQQANNSAVDDVDDDYGDYASDKYSDDAPPRRR